MDFNNLRNDDKAILAWLFGVIFMTAALAAPIAGCMKVGGNTRHTVTVQGEAEIRHVHKIDIDSVTNMCKKSNDQGKCISDIVEALKVNGLGTTAQPEEDDDE
jgi:hypothetical protein